MSQRFNRPDESGVLHYVTLNVRERRQAFARPAYALAVLESLRAACDSYPAKLVAYVAMPNHLHFIVNPQDGALSRFLSRFKPAATKRINALAASANHERARAWLNTPHGRCLWQEGKHSLHLWSDKLIWQKINYIHDNPVRSGLVANPADYLWSSYGAFFPEAGHQVPIPVDFDWWE